MTTLAALAARPMSKITLDTLTTTLADRRTASSFMHRVAPPLLAKMALELDRAPEQVQRMSAFKTIRHYYEVSALQLDETRAPPEWGAWRQNASASFVQAEAEFTSVLHSIREEGTTIRQQFYAATKETRALGDLSSDPTVIDRWMTEFYAKRLTLRLLLGQYVACRAQERGESGEFYLRSTFKAMDANHDGVLEPAELARATSLYTKAPWTSADGDEGPPRPLAASTMCGLVDSAMAPFDIAVQAIADVQEECRASKLSRHQKVPPFWLYGRGHGATVSYLPRHLYKILRDVLRSAARSTLHRNLEDPAPIRVVISDSSDQGDVVFKVADEGGGMSRTQARENFSFVSRSSAAHVQQLLTDTTMCYSLANQHQYTEAPPDIMVCTNHELPISRVYARFFDGDMKIRSMQGYGNDTYIYIKRIATTELPT